MRVASFDFRAKVGVLRLRLQRLSQELGLRTERLLRGKREHWERLELQLQERGPLKVLERGYAIATDAAGNVLRDAAQNRIGDDFAVRLHRGKLIGEVRRKEPS